MLLDQRLRARPRGSLISGARLPEDFVLPVDKPEGPTSHDVVVEVRKRLGRRRVGHTGTLDPFASGLLLVCVGRATRLAEYLSGLDKSYEAVARLGETTDTLDRDGEIVESRSGWQELDRSRVEEALGGLRGMLSQIPPEFSAKKVKGEAAHRRARRGESVDLAPASVVVHELELTTFDLPRVGLRVRCSSGTYVRALARDLGVSLAVGAHLVELRRTAIGAFTVEDAIATDRLADGDAVEAAAISPLEAVAHLPQLDADDTTARLVTHGRPVEGMDPSLSGLVAVAHLGTLLAMGECGGGVLRPRKVFAA
jgi:tRNA pseudouridine55 synthase